MSAPGVPPLPGFVPELFAAASSAPRRAATTASRRRWELPCAKRSSCRSSLSSSLSYSKRAVFVVPVEGNNIIGPAPAGRSDRESLLSPIGEFARGFVVASGESRLRRGKIGIGEVVIAAVSHRQRRIGVAGFGLLEQRGVQKRYRLFGKLWIVGGDECLREQPLDEGRTGRELDSVAQRRDRFQRMRAFKQSLPLELVKIRIVRH